MSTILNNLGFLLRGVPVTLGLSVSAFTLGLILGSAVAALRLSSSRVVRLPAVIYVQAIRSTPVLVQLYLIFFGLPSIGISLPALPSSLIALSLYTGAYCAEIIRAGILSVGSGSILAARSMGMDGWQIFRYVVAPQAFRTVLPPLSSQFIDTTLSSSLAGFIGVADLTQRAVRASAQTFRPFEIYGALGVIYLILIVGLVKGLGRLEHEFGSRRRIYLLSLDVESLLEPLNREGAD